MAWAILGDEIPNPLSVDDNGNSLTVDGSVSTSGAFAEFTGSASANNTNLIDAGDVRGHKTWSLQITGSFNATVSVQGSNDNVNWLSLAGYQPSSANPVLSTTVTAAGLWVGPVSTRYLRVRTSAWVSGTPAATLELTSEPFTSVGAYLFGGLVTGTPVSFAGTSAGADNETNVGLITGGVRGMGFVFNGTSWERLRTANSGAGTTGTGVFGAAAMYHDGTNYQRAALTNPLPVRSPATAATSATLTNVGAQISNLTLIANNVNRKGLILYNDSTAVLYLKFGSVASTTSFTYYVEGGATLELPTVTYTGQIDGIWSAANGTARITELA